MFLNFNKKHKTCFFIYGEGHVPKVRGVKRRCRGPRPCIIEGARGDDRQTDSPSII